MRTLPAPPKRKTAPNNFSRMVVIVEALTNRLLEAERRIAELEASKEP